MSDSDDEVTTLPIRLAPLSPDYVPASPDYSLDSNLDFDLSQDDSPDEDLTETTKSLPTQIALTSVVHPPPSLLPSSSSPPPSVFPSSSLPPPPSAPPPPPTTTTTLPPPPPEIELLEPHDVVTRDSFRNVRGRITRLQLRAVYIEQETRDGVRTQRATMTDQNIETLHARAEAAEQRAEALQASLRAAQMDINLRIII
ncbi:hypothetical protein Tco_0086830 [Tanacetum coccineum]